jgi:hypothetical protein
LAVPLSPRRIPMRRLTLIAERQDECKAKQEQCPRQHLVAGINRAATRRVVHLGSIVLSVVRALLCLGRRPPPTRGRSSGRPTPSLPGKGREIDRPAEGGGQTWCLRACVSACLRDGVSVSVREKPASRAVRITRFYGVPVTAETRLARGVADTFFPLRTLVSSSRQIYASSVLCCAIAAELSGPVQSCLSKLTTPYVDLSSSVTFQDAFRDLFQSADLFK